MPSFNRVRAAFLLTLFLGLYLFSGCSFSLGSKSCETQRYGAFDVGSGTTKALIAEISSCGSEGAKVIWEDSRALGLKEDLIANGKLSPEMTEKSAAVMAELAAKMRKQKAQLLGGVGTMALREAPNGAEFVATISEKTGTPITIISQKEEALLGALSARALRPEVSSHVVWDIGGASAQWVYADHGQTKFQLSSLASVSLKDEVIRFQNKESGASPNPLGREGVQFAQQRVRAEVRTFAPALRESIKASGGVVLGVGGVHRYSILTQLEREESYHLFGVKKAIEARYQWSDDQVGGDYAASDVTNLVLIYAQMKELGIEKIEVAPGNLALGHILKALVTQKHSSP